MKERQFSEAGALFDEILAPESPFVDAGLARNLIQVAARFVAHFLGCSSLVPDFSAERIQLKGSRRLFACSRRSACHMVRLR